MKKIIFNRLKVNEQNETLTLEEKAKISGGTSVLSCSPSAQCFFSPDVYCHNKPVDICT